jgi:hypothetical protein
VAELRAFDEMTASRGWLMSQLHGSLPFPLANKPD